MDVAALKASRSFVYVMENIRRNKKKAQLQLR